MLALPELHQIDIAIVAGEQQIVLLRAGKYHINGDKGDTISLLPLSGAVSGISTKNLKYLIFITSTQKPGPAKSWC